jgi:hypothetical protein
MTLPVLRHPALSSISTAENQPQTDKEKIMFFQPSEEQLTGIPRLYETEHIPTEDKIVQAHFYFGQSHWFVVEYDQVDTLFGFCILNGDLEMAEWGYVSLDELKRFKIQNVFEVVFDTAWTPMPTRDLPLIKQARGIVEDPRNEAEGGFWKWHTLQN